MVLVGGVSGKNCILFDDMADTCGTLCAAAEILKLNGAVQVIAMVIHPILSGEAVRTIESSQLDKLISCDTNPMAAAAKNSPKISQIDTSKIFAEAIRRNHSGESISFLFKHVPDV